MLLEIKWKPNYVLQFCIYVHGYHLDLQKLKIHALPVNNTSSTVQSYSDRKKCLLYMWKTLTDHHTEQTLWGLQSSFLYLQKSAFIAKMLKEHSGTLWNSFPVVTFEASLRAKTGSRAWVVSRAHHRRNTSSLPQLNFILFMFDDEQLIQTLISFVLFFSAATTRWPAGIKKNEFKSNISTKISKICFKKYIKMHILMFSVCISTFL